VETFRPGTAPFGEAQAAIEKIVRAPISADAPLLRVGDVIVGRLM
jgi:hypothetical protein